MKSATSSRRKFLAASAATLAAAGLPSAADATPPAPQGSSKKGKKTETFPKGFIWGTATASYQIEGAIRTDGKSESIWDAFAHKPGAIWRAQNGDTACDHYNRYKEDVAIMKTLGLNGYRFSLAWSRILPDGTGTVNPKGLDFYDRLTDELLKAGVAPYCTLYHWDLPVALHKKGGWRTRDSVGWFTEYAEVVTKRLGDRIKHWMTLNEPQIFIGLGLQVGKHAPGETLPFKEVLQAGHHALLAHGRAVQVIRANSPKCEIGFAPQTPIAYPASEKPEDVAAAREFNFGIQGFGFLLSAAMGIPPKNPINNSWWMDPVFLGEYPKAGLDAYKSDAPEIRDGDMKLISEPVDFCGANIYFGFAIKADANGRPNFLIPSPATPITAFDWPVTPEALYWGPKFFHERYKKPIYITENGVSLRDWIALDGKVHDPQRIDFTTRYLRELRRAAADGVLVKGYFHWSLMDNFEWAEGYKQRFGLVHVDFDTQKRTLKDSALWYRQVAATNGGNL